MRGRRWTWSGALALGAWLGCSPGVFLCEDDASCDQSGTQGVCQANGYCSFPDQECESGQRYGEFAGGTLAGTCVDPEAIATDGSDDGPGPTSPTTTTGMSGTSGTSADDGTAEVTNTGPPLDTGPPPTTTTTEPPGTDDSSGGAVGVECRIDEFDDDVIDPDWCMTTPPGIQLSEQRGQLRFDLVPQDWGGDGEKVGELRTCAPSPLLELTAVAHAEHMPQVSPYTEAFLEVGNDAFRLGMAVLNGELYAFVADNGQYAGVQYLPYEPAGQHFWRIRGAREGLVAEYSPDGNAWAPIHTLARDLTGEQGWVYLGVWAEMVPLGPDSAGFESLEICALAD